MKLTIVAVACAAFLAGAVEASADDAATCTFVTQAVTGFNGSGPYMVDKITRVETGTQDCTGKTVDFNWSILVNDADLQAGWQELLKKQFSGVFCGVPELKEAVGNGWVATANWVTSDAVKFSTGITCP